MFTWSFGWAPSPARFAITSLAFMFDEAPEPVWKTSIGNWSSCLPSATALPAVAMLVASSPSSLPSAPLASAAAPLIRPSQRTTGTGTRSPETGKLSTALVVSPPQSCSPAVVSASTLKVRPPSSLMGKTEAYCARRRAALGPGVREQADERRQPEQRHAEDRQAGEARAERDLLRDLIHSRMGQSLISHLLLIGQGVRLVSSATQRSRTSTSIRVTYCRCRPCARRRSSCSGSRG